jgi:RecA/RadA recombinase
MTDARGAALGRAMAKVNKAYGARTMAVATHRPRVARYTTGSLSVDVALGGGVPIGMMTLIHGSESSGKTTLAARIAGYAQQTCARCHRPRWDLVVEEEADPETGEVVPVARATCDCVATGLVPPPARWAVPFTNSKGDVEVRLEPDADWRARVKAAQANGFEEVRVVYMDVEGTFDPAWAIQLGMDPRRVYLVSPGCAEDAIDIYTTLARSGGVDLMVLDSVAALAPSKEIDESAYDWQQGLAARLVNKLARQATASQTIAVTAWDRPLTQIWINQEREKLGVVFGDNTVLPGGKQQRFSAAVRLKMWPSKWETEATNPDLKEDWRGKVGQAVRINVKAEKNKVSSAMGQGSFILGVHGPDTGRILDQEFVVAQAERCGLLVAGEKGKGWTLGDEAFKAKKDALARMQEPAVAWALREALTARLLGAT